MNTSQVVDESEGRYCRLCCNGGDQEKLRSVFVGNSDNASLLLKKIYECTAVQITAEGVDQNAHLCRDCIDKIDDFYAYRVQCQTNDERIRQKYPCKMDDHSQIAIKQENDLHLDSSIAHVESPSTPETCSRSKVAAMTRNTTTTNNCSEIDPSSVEEPSSDLMQLSVARKHAAHIESNQAVTTDEIIIKRETIVDDDDVYYNSEGEAADVSLSTQHTGQLPTTSGVQKANYRIIMAANKRERLVYEGYLYCRHFTRRDGSTHWRCRLNGCQAAVNLMLDNVIVPANNNGHCHSQNAPDEQQADDSTGIDCDLTMTDGEASYVQTEEQDGADAEGNVDSEPVLVEPDSMHIVTNKKKGETLIHLGFKYCKRYLKMDGSTFWKCRSNNNKCNAGVYVYPDERVKYHGSHNHEKVVYDGEDQDPDTTMDSELPQGYTIIENVDDDEEEQVEVSYSEDIATLLTNSLEVMMPGDERKQQKQTYEITTNVKGRECLILEGHQYSKDRERSDGAVLWRCRRNYDKCRALAIILPNGSVEKCGNHQHETDKRYLERREQGDGSRLYRIAKNQRGNDALVFDGHRFSKEWSRVDGSIIWRCSYRSGICKVKVVLNAEGFVHRMGTEQEHDHETTEPQIFEEAPSIDEEVEIVEEPSMQSSVRNRPKLMTQPSVQFHNSNITAEQQAAGGYRIVRNRKGFEALVHDGYRYCKVRVRQDGSVKWLCKMNKKTCRAAVDLLTDGTIAKANEFDHNHERPADIEEQDDDDEGDVPHHEITYPIDPEVFGSSQWYYVKNSKNGMSMIHAGYRYTKKCDRVDGTSLWRCSAAQRGCKAGVILFPNDTLAMVENAEHSHKPYESVKPPPDCEPELEVSKNSEVIEIKETDDVLEDSEMNMHSLLQTVLGTDDVGWSGGNDTENDINSESVWYNSATDRPYPKPEHGQPTFRIIKNRRNTDSLVHRGYRYCKIRDRVDGSILWACQMNKKTCKASVNLTTDGCVELINGTHNHEKTDIDDSVSDRDLEQALYSPDTDVEPENEKPVTKPKSSTRKHPDYYFSTNKSNRECLIHKSYRFCKRSERPDGTTSWRCSMGGNTCMVVVTIHPDGTPEENSIKHNHQPLIDLPPEVERVAKTETVETPKANTSNMHNRQGDVLEWNGFHYRKIKELPDGSIIWICQVDSCRVAVKMLPNGQLKMLSESEHNHTAAGHLPSVGGSGIPSTSKSSSNSNNVSGTETTGKCRNYRLFKNQRGQMTMLYNGYRYSIRNRNQDGSSSWKCRANSSCRVTIFLMPDDRIMMGSNNTEHNHVPNWESTKKLEVISQTRVNPLYDYLNIVPGGSSQIISKIQNPADCTISTPQPQKSATPDTNNFGRNVIEHKGFYYKLVVRKKNGREYWRCVHFKNRVCRAALFCRDTGTIVTSSNGKEHTHGGGADARPVPSATNSNKIQASSSRQNQARSAVQPSPPDEVQLTVGDEERYIDHGDYVIAKNRKDQNTLIFKDRRYYLSYNRSDGSAVWRCAHRKRYKCYAYVRLRPDGRLLSTGEHEHSHSSKSDEHSPLTPGAVETRNYRIVKNRVGNDILIHDSHRFRLNYQRNDGTTHWRCIWARSNHCSAGVYLFVNGLLKNAANEAAIIHNHPPPSQVKKAVTAKANIPVQQNELNRPVVGNQSRTIPEDDGILDYKFVEEGSNKILTCRGYRYWYTWIRKDGSIYYRCAEVKNLQCPMGILLLPNKKLVRANENCHNHDASLEEQEEEFLGFPMENQHAAVSLHQNQQEEIDTLQQFPPLSIPRGGDTNFKIVKTSRGESLIYKGYRYWAKNRLANGVVSLCCTRKKMKKCPAMLRLMTDGRVTDPIGAGHTHPPSIEGAQNTGEIRTNAASVVTVTPKSIPTGITPKEAVRVRPTPPAAPAAKLAALSFNEESDDDAEGGDESLIGSKRYSFMKSSAQRNFIIFEGFVYDFEHKQHDGCVFYRCKTNEACPASLMLLTNGRVMHMDEILHIHEKPDLSNMRPVGRGSKEFKIVQNKNGSNILVHRGHRYTTPRAKTDGAGIWYCHTYIPDVNRRCYVPIELLPNGRVAPVGDKQHNHKAPFKTKHDTDNESTGKLEHSNGVSEPNAKSDTRMLLLGGHQYNYAHQRDDGAVLWKCTRKSCNASMYRLLDGQIVRGPEHNHEKLEPIDSTSSTTVKRKFSELDTKVKSSSPIASSGEFKPTSIGSARSAQHHLRGGESQVKINPYIGRSIINEGYRYIYYLTRRDGSEHWRCCRRISMKCRGGLFKQVDGTLMKSNDEGHSHSPDHTDQEDFIPLPSTLESLEESNDTLELEEEEAMTGVSTTVTESQSSSFVDNEGSYDYELIDVKGKKRGFYLVHKGAMFVTGHTRRDRARYYRCRTVGCKVAMLLHRNGLLVRSNEHTHDCQNAVKPEEEDKAALGPESKEPGEKKLRMDFLDGHEVVEASMEGAKDSEEESTSDSNETTECVVVEVKDDESL